MIDTAMTPTKRRRATVPPEHLTKAEVLSVIPMLEAITPREVVERCQERYGSRLNVRTLQGLDQRVRHHLSRLGREGRLQKSAHGWYRVNRV